MPPNTPSSSTSAASPHRARERTARACAPRVVHDLLVFQGSIAGVRVVKIDVGGGKLVERVIVEHRPVAVYVSPGFLTEYMHVFLAEGLEEAHAEADEDEDIVVVRVPLAEAVRMAERGELRDAKTIAAILLAARRLLK